VKLNDREIKERWRDEYVERAGAAERIQILLLSGVPPTPK